MPRSGLVSGAAGEKKPVLAGRTLDGRRPPGGIPSRSNYINIENVCKLSINIRLEK